METTHQLLGFMCEVCCQILFTLGWTQVSLTKIRNSNDPSQYAAWNGLHFCVAEQIEKTNNTLI